MKCLFSILSLLLLSCLFCACVKTTKLARGNKPKHINKMHLRAYIRDCKAKYKVPDQHIPKKQYK